LTPGLEEAEAELISTPEKRNSIARFRQQVVTAKPSHVWNKKK
jgi:hypothetical protein